MGDSAQNTRWIVFQRTQEVASEFRVAVIRLAAIATFYLIHLYTYLNAEAGVDYQTFHQRVSLICGVWCLVSIAIFMGIGWRSMPVWVKYLTTGTDLLFLTAVALLNAGGNSYEVILFPLIVAMSILRFSDRLVCFATLSGIGCFLLLVGRTDQVWFDTNHEVPLLNTLMTVACIAFTGITGWQIVSAMRRTVVASSPVVGDKN